MELDNYDYVIVGAGLSGSVIARQLAEDVFRVVIFESKENVSGHIYDEVNEIGFLVQKYGPHMVHTNKQNVYEFITKYHKWIDYKLECEVYMEGKFTASPFNLKTIDNYFSSTEAIKIKTELKSEYPNLIKVTILELLNSKNSIVKNMQIFYMKRIISYILQNSRAFIRLS